MIKIASLAILVTLVTAACVQTVQVDSQPSKAGFAEELEQEIELEEALTTCAIGDAPFPEIIAACTRVLEDGRFFGSPEVRAVYQFARGQAYYNNADYNRAIEDAGRAIELDESNAMSYAIRGLAYMELAKYETAMKDYNKAIELDENSAAYYAYRGLAHIAQKNFHEAGREMATAKLKGYEEPWFLKALENLDLPE